MFFRLLNSVESRTSRHFGTHGFLLISWPAAMESSLFICVRWTQFNIILIAIFMFCDTCSPDILVLVRRDWSKGVREGIRFYRNYRNEHECATFDGHRRGEERGWSVTSWAGDVFLQYLYIMHLRWTYSLCSSFPRGRGSNVWPQLPGVNIINSLIIRSSYSLIVSKSYVHF